MAQGDEQAIAILHAIIVLGHNLGMTVTAEGVADVEQLRTVLTLNCNFAQGFLFGRPVTRQDALEQCVSDAFAGLCARES